MAYTCSALRLQIGSKRHRNAFVCEHRSSAQHIVQSLCCYNWASKINIDENYDSCLCLDLDRI